MPNPWTDCPGLPPGAAAVLAALHLREPQAPSLTDAQWQAALGDADRARLTLSFRDRARGSMPDWVRERVDRNAAQNQVRLDSTVALYAQLSEWLHADGLQFVALKGITHSVLAATGHPPSSRQQYDIDLFVPQDRVHRAQVCVIGHGYEPLEGMDRFPTDHLPALVRKTGWQWRGDFFDTEIPLSVELHFRFWNGELEHLPAAGTEEFWTRRVVRPILGVELAALHPPDAIAYAALHLLKHILRGSAKPFHAYEIACMLEATAGDSAFWSEWRKLHSPQLRRLEAVVYRLANAWFGCRYAAAVEEEIEQLPDGAQTWFDEFALAPVTATHHPNKDELWLHLSLVESRWDGVRVARRRLLPANLPPYAENAFLTPEKNTVRRRARRWVRWGRHVAGRLRHHAIALPQTALSGGRWWWRTNSLGPQFWAFLISAAVFNFALFIFVLLYNLFLLDLGFGEDFIGTINSASRLGGVVGTLPAAYVAYRFGLRNTLIATIGATAIAEVLRAVIGSRLPLAGLAFVSGCVFSFWAVILAPTIAGCVTEKRRPTAFSVFFAAMFSVGIAGNWLGGRLPLWLHGKQNVLLCSGALSAVAILPALRLRLMPASGRTGVGHDSAPGGSPAAATNGCPTRIYPRSRFLFLFLSAFAVWHLATGTFNPLNNVYFKRLGFADARIGSAFSLAQLVQVGALAMAPFLIRRLGLLNGIVSMMAATAFGLAALSLQPPGMAAVGAYIAYMSFQWMSEPGLNTLLMNQVGERERSGASALTFLVAFGAQAIAAFAGGRLISQFGYGPVLIAAAMLAIVAAVLFRGLLGAKQPAPSPPAVPSGIASN